MRLEELRKAYRSTWLEWARQTDAMQQVIDRAGNGRDTAQLEKALLAVECARAAHNSARDGLARALGEHPRADNSNAAGDGRVRETAHLLWEFAGRPDGTAESDWQRAQTMVRGAGDCG